MAATSTLTDAEAQYLAEIWEDCEDCLGPNTELLDLQREPADEGVRLVARYRLGERERQSAAVGESMLAAHSVLRARILFDRMRFGFSDVVARH
ncbi:MAG TPA: hypothetical protein VF494_07305 [Candidatus Limnocylindrales bacterium]